MLLVGDPDVLCTSTTTAGRIPLWDMKFGVRLTDGVFPPWTGQIVNVALYFRTQSRLKTNIGFFVVVVGYNCVEYVRVLKSRAQ